MSKIVIIKSNKEISGVFVSPDLIGDVDLEFIDFDKQLTPWDDNTLEQIEKDKLKQIG